ncbi:hypothetical protein L1987_68726 [Smallanthus sonchifolius]|uniref:Uncharacterized protein n=1 Tax=Smallanthus sonchifolius TaxID=185202 RepID=A0ACB9B589_9ASTR|nr:hypothetical protein L1987_68726 [Smallanthus sonchifolius]
MEEEAPPPILEGKITGISFSLATRQEICLASISDCPISHASQLSNPFLGLPLEVGKCESCGAAEVGKCEGHFGYIELPIPIYHPSHISELKRILSLICLKCLKFKNQRLSKNVGVLERAFAFCCEEVAQVTVIENQKKDGACFLELKLPSRRGIRDGFWDFLDRYGYRYGGDAATRPLLPSEVLKILKKIPEATKKKLAGRGCFFQEGYIMQHLPVPPNCLSTPDVSDGITVTSSDISMPMLKKVLRQVEIIKSSRSGAPNFESLEVEVNDLQLAVAQYLQSRGAKATPDRNTRYAIARTANDTSSTKAWLEKMKTLFISKGSGFSSRSVITGDPYKGVGEIGIPFEIAQRITFEERVTEYNMKFLQKLVDDKLCLTYRDGQSTYSLREGSKGHTFLKPGQARDCGPLWTVLELLETSLPRGFECVGDKFVIRDSKILKLDYSRDAMQSIINEIISSIFFSKGPNEVLKLFNSLQPMLMENLCGEGFNLSLEDFIVPSDVLISIEDQLQEVSSLLYHLRSNYNEVIDTQLEKHLRASKIPISDFILRFSSMGNLIDPKSDSALTRIVQQIGFLGLQIYERGRLYSRTMVEDLSSHFLGNYPFPQKYPYEEFGLIRSCLFHGLDPYQELVHSVANREVMIRSSRGLTEPGILFKNSMAILRDVVICYDGTVRNVCSNSVIQFEYGAMAKNLFAAGEPVGVLAATAMSNPAYKAVLDSSPSSNSSWNMMKEILQCGVNFKNVHNDRRVVLYLNDCDCGKEHCRENAAWKVKNHLRKVSLKDVAVEFLIEYRRPQVTIDDAESDAGLVGHVHLNKTLLKDSNISMEEVLIKCEDGLNLFHKKKKVGQLFKKIAISCSECSFQQSSEWTPCLKFFWQDIPDIHLEKTAHIFADAVCPVLLNSIIKGDPRVKEANITWVSPETTAWIKNPLKDQKGEIAIDVVLEKEAVKKSGDAWRTVMDACLPVIHLIDTTRSIPYAIKQVEHLLGIACAFEQAVQRLSTSVSMVTKGMLKEHLLLLASSMTCAGFLVGFNLAGIKALNKTLNFQVPFSEATVYTPKRCFEKAAEKCHADSLSSIVGACSWGKPVAVGTGSRFDILWDTREVELNHKDGIDVYNFLHLVGGGSEEADSGCLGGEVDSYDMEANFMETGSPEIDSGLAKPVFEDGLDLNLDGMDAGQSNWGAGPAPEDGTSSGGWGGAVKTTTSTCGGWGEAKSDQGQQTGSSGGWGATKSQKDAEPSGAWGLLGKKDDIESGWGAKKSENETDKGSGAWGQKVSKGDEPAWGSKKTENDNAEGSGSGSWGQKVIKEDGPGWGGNRSGNETEKGSGAWGQKVSKGDEPAWGSKKNDNDTEKGSGSGSWGQKVVKGDVPGWGAKKSESETEKGSGAWGQTVAKGDDPAWGAKRSQNEAEKEPVSGAWGQKVVKGDGPGWGGNKSRNDTEKGSGSGWGQKVVTADEPKWGEKKIVNDTSKGFGPGSWGQKVVKSDGPGWNSKPSPVDQADLPKESSTGDGQWGKKDSWKAPDGSSSSSWGKSIQKTDTPSWNKGTETAGESAESDKCGSSENKIEGSDWSKKVEEKTDSKGGWGQNKDQISGTDGSTEKEQEVAEQKPGSWGWNRKADQKPDQGGGWKKKENWGPKRDRPARPFGGPNDGPRSGGGPLTASRQRLDIFTADEQEILTEIEPIMQSVRRIMSQTGYNDGDPLSADDQTYILENVFTHHPDKAQKAGAGVDYIMVTKHTEFQDSRCFFVVSTDGRKEDFSYRKCLENFIRGKYPDKVDEFIPKYFRKGPPRPPRDEAGTPRSRAGWNRDSSVAADEAGTPRSQSTWKRETSLAADEAAPPVSGWKKEASTTQEGGTPATGWNQGWKKETSKAPEEGGTPATGWNQGWKKEASTASEEGGPPATKAADGGSTQKSGLDS